jgi:hypothetical protein
MHEKLNKKDKVIDKARDRENELLAEQRKLEEKIGIKDMEI